jgi:hypothetical protein
MTSEPNGSVPGEWLCWMKDIAAVLEEILQEDPIEVESEDNMLATRIKMAVFARVVTFFEGALLLAEHDRTLDMRAHARMVIESTIYMVALDRDAGVIEKMKDEDFKSRHSRAKLNAEHITVDNDVRDALNEFLAASTKGIKPIEIGSLLNGNEFERLYRTYRNISADTAHVSMTSLDRHFIDGGETGIQTLVANPALDLESLQETLGEMGIATLVATFMLMRFKGTTNCWDELSVLAARYQTIIAAEPVLR